MDRTLIMAATCAALPALWSAPPALADVTIALGGGWEATIFEEDFVDLAVDFVSIEQDILVIEKFANFVSVDPLTGQPDPIRIAFNQVAPDDQTVSRIVIADELVSNNTGLDWFEFEMVLLGDQASFDPFSSQAFTFDPFTSMEFSDDNGSVLFSGGTILDGDIWTPGAEAGELFIDIDLSSDFMSKFVLKEIPRVVPVPGALALLGIAAAAGRRRRRSA